MWKLERPKPALPSSYFWTWDHSTNWTLDDPGLLTFGCGNRYMKKPETFVEDYRRLTDLASGIGVKGILIWGFIRDSHGGIEHSKKVADYASSKNICIMPGIGTTSYGGVYYEGNSKYSITEFLKKNPDAHMICEDGSKFENETCPLHPLFREWLEEGIRWLFKEFAIGGANLENGDFLVCHDDRCKAHKKNWPKDDPDFFRLQALSYVPAVAAMKEHLKDKLVTWATYSGFVPGPKSFDKENNWAMPNMECEKPEICNRIDPMSICQWTITHMVHQTPLPLSVYLDDGIPKEALNNPRWPDGLKAPAKRSVGFIHQASQWSHIPRYNQAISVIKEGCLMAYRSGLEGVSIHGEVSSRFVPWALNYLAFSHFIHWPEDNLRDFAKKTLAQVLTEGNEAESFVEILTGWDSGTLTESQKKDAKEKAGILAREVAGGKGLERWRFWDWIWRMTEGFTEKHTASFF